MKGVFKRKRLSKRSAQKKRFNISLPSLKQALTGRITLTTFHRKITSCFQNSENYGKMTHRIQIP
ncbi:MAG: hypothetical protein IIY77_02845, partial [Lachnospiraceae bacterium]|nr:hypothetical protein [Lachnospiraceae bacterium]